jgi:NADH-quinone oxidoreductase subunit J
VVIAFYLASALALAAATVALTRAGAVHALLLLAVAFVAAAVVLLTLGAPLVAALHVIVYAGAIVVLFLFAVMVAGLSSPAIAGERQQLTRRSLALPVVFATAIAALLIASTRSATGAIESVAVEPTAVGFALLVALLLFAGLLAAHHVARRDPPISGGNA